jgi:simple sugar transport system ATP-binding protein
VSKDYPPAGEPILEVRDLTARGDRGEEALKGITLSLHSHEILGVAGVAGNGQKELFEVLAGVRRAEAGEVTYAGANIANLSPGQVRQLGLAYIPADRLSQGLVPEFTVAENLILGQQRAPTFRRGPFLDRERMARAAKSLIASFGIVTPSPNHVTRNLSGGNSQKVILARELSRNPRCLIASQPTRGLDVGVIEYLHRRLLNGRDAGMAILLISEDLDEILNLSSRIAVIFKGQITGIIDSREARREQIGMLMAGMSLERRETQA